MLLSFNHNLYLLLRLNEAVHDFIERVESKDDTDPGLELLHLMVQFMGLAWSVFDALALYRADKARFGSAIWSEYVDGSILVQMLLVWEKIEKFRYSMFLGGSDNTDPTFSWFRWSASAISRGELLTRNYNFMYSFSSTTESDEEIRDIDSTVGADALPEQEPYGLDWEDSTTDDVVIILDDDSGSDETMEVENFPEEGLIDEIILDEDEIILDEDNNRSPKKRTRGETDEYIREECQYREEGQRSTKKKRILNQTPDSFEDSDEDIHMGPLGALPRNLRPATVPIPITGSNAVGRYFKALWSVVEGGQDYFYGRVDSYDTVSRVHTLVYDDETIDIVDLTRPYRGFVLVSELEYLKQKAIEILQTSLELLESMDLEEFLKFNKFAMFYEDDDSFHSFGTVEYVVMKICQNDKLLEGKATYGNGRLYMMFRLIDETN